MAKGDYSEAISDLNAANNIAPSSGEYGLARIYALKGDAATSVYHLESDLKSPFRKREKEIMLDPAFSMIENRPEWRQFWKKEWYDAVEKGISEIEYYVSTGNIDEAKSALSELSESYPGNDSNVYAEALISFCREKISEAIKTLTILIDRGTWK